MHLPVLHTLHSRSYLPGMRHSNVNFKLRASTNVYYLQTRP